MVLSTHVAVPFEVGRDVAFDYLADPANRPQWQSSLRRIDELDPGVPRIGLQWADVTWPGLRPRMRIAGYERPRYWAEWGQWRESVTAWLALQFLDQPEGRCLVWATLEVEIRPRALRRLGPVITVLARPAVRADLRRASRVLAARQ
jgi:hypothetical protein